MHDDTCAFGRALKAGSIWIPPGEYMVRYGLMVCGLQSRRIIGAGHRSVIKIAVKGRVVTLWDCSDFVLADFVVDGNCYGVDEAEQNHGIFVRESNTVRIENVTVRDVWGDGIYFHTSDCSGTVSHGHKVSNCAVLNAGRVGVQFGNGGVHKDAIVQGCYFETDSEAIKSEPTSSAAERCEGPLFQHARILNNAYVDRPVGIHSAAHVICSGNRRLTKNSGGGAGVQVAAGRNVIVSRNQIVGDGVATNHGVHVYAWSPVTTSHIVISGNQIEGTFQSGVLFNMLTGFVAPSSGFVIRGNHLIDAGAGVGQNDGNGIHVFSQFDTVINQPRAFTHMIIAGNSLESSGTRHPIRIERVPNQPLLIRANLFHVTKSIDDYSTQISSVIYLWDQKRALIADNIVAWDWIPDSGSAIQKYFIYALGNSPPIANVRLFLHGNDIRDCDGQVAGLGADEWAELRDVLTAGSILVDERQGAGAQAP